MSLNDLQKQGRLRSHRTSREEIGSLIAIVERDLKDAAVLISPDRRFATAYNAALQLATIVLYCQGYRTRGGGHHATTFAALQETPLAELSAYSV